MNVQNYSIKNQLILLISVPILLLSICVASFSIFSAYEEIEEVSDAQLVHSAKVLFQLTEHEVGEHNSYKIQLGIERPELIHRYENKITFRIWKKDKLVTGSYQSKNFNNFRAPPGFSNRSISGEKWRFFVFVDGKTKITIEVAEKNEIRDEFIFKIIVAIFVPLLLFIPLLFLIIWYGVIKSLKPVVKLSLGVDQRCSDDFTEIKISTIPQEIHPLIKAINRLLFRIKSSFERERQFTDNAAHELRTPLAAMKTQAQVLLKKIKNGSESKEGLENLNSSIDRASNLVDQLLSFARLQGEKIEFKKLNLSFLTEEILKETAKLAINKNINLEAKIESQIMINGNYNALGIMIRNLVGNAIKFTPSGGNVTISLNNKENKIILSVLDTGIGILDKQKNQVFERFYRIDKNTIGSGLGLSIVKWVCRLHKANIHLENNNPIGLIAIIEIDPLDEK